MLRRLSLGSIMTGPNWTAFLSPLLAVLNPLESMLKFLEPDLTIGTNTENYRGIYRTVNHELAHASHFSKITRTDPTADYWRKYIGYIVNCAFDNNSYGDGSRNYAGHCAVGEMWGFAMGQIQAAQHFAHAAQLDAPYSGPIRGDGDWIRPDPIWALITRGVLTKREVFDSMTSDIDTVNKWRNKLIAMYPSKAVEITTAFETGDVPLPPAPQLTVKNKTSFAIFSVTDPPPGATFEWQFNGSDVPDRNGSALTVFSYGPRELIPIQLSLAAPNAIPLKTIVRVRCRMVQNRRRSNWSETVSATITVTSPPSGGGSGGGGAHAPVAPILSASSDIVNFGANVTFRVTNYTTGSGRSFEWKKDGVVTGSSTAVSQTYRLQAASMSVQCRVRQDGQWSAWSSTKLVKVPPTPFVLPFGDSPAEQDGPEGPASME